MRNAMSSFVLKVYHTISCIHWKYKNKTAICNKNSQQMKR